MIEVEVKAHATNLDEIEKKVVKSWSDKKIKK